MPIQTKSIRRTLDDLIRRVWEENVRLKASGLVTMTWGNVSGIDRRRGIVVIKPSGMDYAALRPSDMVLTDLDGRRLEPASRLESARMPSTDLPTHLVLYREFAEIGGVVHTHSTYATAFAQACRSLPCLGTTHADYCYGEVPVTEVMRPSAIREDYEANTGWMIVKKIRRLRLQPRCRLQPGCRLQPMDCPFIFVANHAPFAWGATPSAAVENAIVLEAISKMALLTILLDSPRRSLGGRRTGISQALLDKHYLRKHGKTAYYGQSKLDPSR
jgi:L-ribulose-5-phosphate 4-epimerase